MTTLGFHGWKSADYMWLYWTVMRNCAADLFKLRLLYYLSLRYKVMLPLRNHIFKYSQPILIHILFIQCVYLHVAFKDMVMGCTGPTFDRYHDDVIKWRYFPCYLPFVRGIQRSPVNSPHKGQWREALMFSLICACINDWVNNREAGDLRRYRAIDSAGSTTVHTFLLWESAVAWIKLKMYKPMWLSMNNVPAYIAWFARIGPESVWCRLPSWTNNMIFSVCILEWITVL